MAASWGDLLSDHRETSAHMGAEGTRARDESLSMLLSRQVPEKYSDNLQICSVLVLSKMSKISC